MLPKLTLDSLLAGVEIPLQIQSKLDELTSSEYFPLMDPSGYHAILNIIAYALKNNWTIDQINTFLFNPVKPTREQLDIFRTRHEQIYAEQAIGMAREVDELDDQFFSISSSMYAGKSTLAAEVCSNLAQIGYRVIPIVPDFMVEVEEDQDDEAGTAQLENPEASTRKKKPGFITLRGKTVKPGDTVGNDGFTRIEALAYTAADCEIFFNSLNIQPNEKIVIHFDEYSFMGPEDVLYFRNYVQQKYPNIKVLFVGLNKNALGKELEGYAAIKESVATEMVCRSFVPNILENIDDQCEPTGTHTSRYVVLPNGFHVLDCGFLPVVVPKEFAQIVYYTPSNAEHHMYNILLECGQVNLLNQVVSPDENQDMTRVNLFHALRSTQVIQEA